MKESTEKRSSTSGTHADTGCSKHLVALTDRQVLENLEGIRVFITDGYWRKTLAAVRALGRLGISVTAGESTYLAPALFSRYCHKRVRTPSPVLEPSRYITFLDNYLSQHQHHVLLPMEEETLLLLAKNRDRFEEKTRLPIADYYCLALARNKLKILRHAETLGIPTPRTIEINSLEEARILRKNLPYPLVIKPRMGSGSAGVQYVAGSNQLIAAVEHVLRSGQELFAQERLPVEGAGIGASFLLDQDHRVRASFLHRRLREYPVRGGPSTLRKSVIHDQARQDGARLLQSIGFVGVAMVEFKIDTRDGQAKLLEVNPRFWGSLALAIKAGVNFPYLLTLMALGCNFAPVVSYRPGQLCRWFIPGDVLHFLHNPNRWHLNPGFFRFHQPNLSYDIIDLDDPLPILGSILALFPFYGSRDFEHVRMRRAP